jgi:NADPH:quinone reductase-like Zn-dependent oxidoreductase
MILGSAPMQKQTHEPIHTVVVDKVQLHQAKIATDLPPALSANQVRLQIDQFALTANNMTYAAFGKAMRYWDFYPRADGGVVPVWGFATVVESASDHIATGRRFYGYYPMASQVVFTSARVSERGFTVEDGARADLAAVYNNYISTAHDPFYRADNEAVQILLRPLFATSWLLADFFADSQFFGATTLLCTSASSKTAYAMAHLLKQTSACRLVGLTSASNRDFCVSLGCYDQVLTYDQLAQLDSELLVSLVDFAGNAQLRQQIHQRFGQLKYSCSVGGTHHDALGGGNGLPGPRPILFFAPAQMKKRQTDWGPAVFGQKLVAGWSAFSQHCQSQTPPWIEVIQRRGGPAVLAAWQQLASGAHQQPAPRTGLVLSF